MLAALFFLLASFTGSVSARNTLARTPPMGWMSWEIFRCNLYSPTDDCSDKTTTNCISQALYQGQADAMVSQGFAAAGYASIHMDDVRAG
jgi:alpha-N-acetylgalactosaminidase